MTPLRPDPRFEPGDPPDSEAPTFEEREQAFGRRVDAAYQRHVDRLLDGPNSETGGLRPAGSS
jgi:hypothetical protein